MRVAVVFESLFGSTHEVAEAIAQGVSEAEPEVQVDLMRVAEADPERVAAADLLIVGGPTHIRGMTTGFSRKMGVSAEATKDLGESQEVEPGAEGPGIRDWFHGLPRTAAPRRAAAFDTRIDARLAGGAAHGIASRLRHHGYKVVVEPEGFFVQDNGEGPLKTGEQDRARAWGAGLVRMAPARTSH